MMRGASVPCLLRQASTFGALDCCPLAWQNVKSLRCLPCPVPVLLVPGLLCVCSLECACRACLLFQLALFFGAPRVVALITVSAACSLLFALVLDSPSLHLQLFTCPDILAIGCVAHCVRLAPPQDSLPTCTMLPQLPTHTHLPTAQCRVEHRCYPFSVCTSSSTPALWLCTLSTVGRLQEFRLGLVCIPASAAAPISLKGHPADVLPHYSGVGFSITSTPS